MLQQGLADLILPWFHLSGLPDEGDGGHALGGLVAQHARQGDLRPVMPEVPRDARLPDLGEFGEEFRDRLSIVALLPAEVGVSLRVGLRRQQGLPAGRRDQLAAVLLFAAKPVKASVPDSPM